MVHEPVRVRYPSLVRDCIVTGRVRTSSGMFLSRGQDDVVTRIEHRIARVSGVPFENGESLQILHYGARSSAIWIPIAFLPVRGPTPSKGGPLPVMVYAFAAPCSKLPHPTH